MNDCQGDREGRPYNTNVPVLHVNVYCTGDPRGRPGSPNVFLAIIHILTWSAHRLRRCLEGVADN
ncbi:MAG: hypothetical protein E6I93_15995 [Chloroflexi bacterium]|nr:MAG: hypothetical protein E6I93_15995 [Chloroflexota bacterium]